MNGGWKRSYLSMLQPLSSFAPLLASSLVPHHGVVPLPAPHTSLALWANVTHCDIANVDTLQQLPPQGALLLATSPLATLLTEILC